MIVIVDYKMGNPNSVANMLKKCGQEALISGDPRQIAAAAKLIIPGVGAFDAGMNSLSEIGLIDVLNKKAVGDKTPVLGICLGMQLFTKKSEEGKLPGLAWINAETRRFTFDPNPDNLKIPHMGWNTVSVQKESRLFSGFDGTPRFYFVHSYHLVCNDASDISAKAEYGYEFAAAVERGNILGVQFHPEKSHNFGLRMLKNFVDLY